MARLTPDQWERVRSDWCTGLYTYEKLSAMHNVSDAAIIKKKKTEGWEQLPREVVDQYIDAKVASKLAISEVSKVSKVSATNLESSLDRIATEKAMIQEDMTEIRGLMMDVVRDKRAAGELSTIDCKVAMEAAAKEHEVKFGKSPDTAVQVNVGGRAQEIPITLVGVNGN